MKKGFTLIELLIVIGVLGILATTTVLVLDPSEILKRSRDVQRLTDLRNLRNAIDLYLVRTPNPTLNGAVCMQGSTDKNHLWRVSNPVVPGFGPQELLTWIYQPFVSPNEFGDAQPSATIPVADGRKIDGNGWASVPLNQITGINPPISRLPVDPINIADNSLDSSIPPPFVVGGGHFYAYQCYGLTYEMNANMESEKYSFGGDKDVESTDGGIVACGNVGEIGSGARCDPPIGTFDHPDGGGKAADRIYEIGNDPGLDL